MNMMARRNGSVRLAVYMAATVLAISGAIVVTLAINHLAAVAIPLAVTAACLIVLVRVHSRDTHYVCPECKHRFRIEPLTDLISPHLPYTKLLVCPECKQRNWCEVQSEASDNNVGTASCKPDCGTDKEPAQIKCTALRNALNIIQIPAD